MDFYSALSTYYDEIFPVTPADMAFIREQLTGAERILDLGCGTGNKTELLAEAGRTISAVDLDADMIAIARARHAAPGIRYEAMDMAKVGEVFPAASFDAALCLGNTLVHLIHPGAVQRQAASVRSLLRKGGLFCVQILNYDLVLDTPILELPLLETPQLTFQRRYEQDDELLVFHSRLELKADKNVWEKRTRLLPLRPYDLRAAFVAAGFGDLREYGNFAGGPASADSLVYILSGRAV